MMRCDRVKEVIEIKFEARNKSGFDSCNRWALNRREERFFGRHKRLCASAQVFRRYIGVVETQSMANEHDRRGKRTRASLLRYWCRCAHCIVRASVQRHVWAGCWCTCVCCIVRYLRLASKRSNSFCLWFPFFHCSESLPTNLFHHFLDISRLMTTITGMRQFNEFLELRIKFSAWLAKLQKIIKKNFEKI